MEKTIEMHPPTQPHSVMIADNDADVRAGLRLLLARQLHFRVVGECTSAGELHRAAAVAGPDLILLDLELRGLRVADDLGKLRAACPRTAILGLSATRRAAPRCFGRRCIGLSVQERISSIAHADAGDGRSTTPRCQVNDPSETGMPDLQRAEPGSLGG